jgi:hypothetical protein
VAAGWYGITAFGFTTASDPLGAASRDWPAAATIARLGGRPELVLFLHPQCPCSRATVAALEQLSSMVPADRQPSICVVIATPRSVGTLWNRSPLEMRAARLPYAHVLYDPGGAETSIFNAGTSGTVLLFDAQGRRLYGGGVTMARGHDGLNTGLLAVAALLVDPSARVTEIPPFGCELVRDNPPSGESSPAAGLWPPSFERFVSSPASGGIASRTAGGEPQ